MNKRLHKKKRVGEFATHLFEVAFIPTPGLTGDAMLEFCARMESWAHSRVEEMCLGTGWTVEQDGFVTKACSGLASAHKKYGDLDDDDRADVRCWMLSQPEVKEVWIGPLIDSYCDKWWPAVGPNDTTLPT